MDKVKITDVIQITQGQLDTDIVRQFYLEVLYCVVNDYRSTSDINDILNELTELPEKKLEHFKTHLEGFIDDLIIDGILTKVQK
jgi:DNA-directed RNA polymerase delta subunit